MVKMTMTSMTMIVSKSSQGKSDKHHLNMRTIKELHCKSAFKLIYVTDNEMSDVIDYLEQIVSKKMENIIQKMSQIVKYVVLTVFESDRALTI